jgi:ElaB/YqjD/DUF883 family membrane-anchored ribosome-binding protein
METTQQETHQRICNDIVQLQVDLDGILNRIVEQAGSRINPERQAAVQQGVEDTKQLLERFKHRYVEAVN